MNTPQETLSEITKSLPAATFFDWYRGDGPRQGILSVYRDNVPANIREIVQVKFYSHKIVVERRRLTDYDAAKHCWNTYCGQDEYELPTRAGEKTLRAILKEHALRITGHSNPLSFASYHAAV
jgi:hypothetical protein